MATAIDTLSKFHIVLSMEWLAYGGPQGMPLMYYYIHMTAQIPMILIETSFTTYLPAMIISEINSWVSGHFCVDNEGEASHNSGKAR